MIGLDAALEQPGLRIAAWDRSREGSLTVVAVTRHAVTVLARETIAHAHGENKACEVVREGTNADLVRFLRSGELVETLLPLMTKLTEATR